MKKVIFLLVLFSATTFEAISQPYKSLFGTTQTSWNVYYFIPSDWTITDSFYVCNDTLINGLNYRLINSDYNGGYDLTGFLREDTTTGRAWFLDKSWFHEEYLIMDLSLNVGDTFIIHNTQFPEDSIAIVDSIKNDIGNKVIYMTSAYGVVEFTDNVLSFTEGIGPNAGIIFQHEQGLDFENGTRLLCSYKDFVQVYSNSGYPFYGDCSLLGGGIEENQIDNSKLTLFPNPTCDKIQIEYHGQTPYCFELIDYTGQVLYSKEKITSLAYEFDMTNYSNGFYLVMAYGDNRLLSVGKIFKF